MPRLAEQLRQNTVALISLIVALTSLSYNTWRNEASETNRTVRAAGFEMLEELAGLQQVVLFARFYPDDQRGDATVGWAHVLAARDFAYPMPRAVQDAAGSLHSVWSAHFAGLAGDDAAGYRLVDEQIETTKAAILAALAALD